MSPLQRRRVQWVALADTEPSAHGLVHLADTLERLAPGAAQGPDLWPRYLVVADPLCDTFWYRICLGRTGAHSPKTGGSMSDS